MAAILQSLILNLETNVASLKKGIDEGKGILNSFQRSNFSYR